MAAIRASTRLRPPPARSKRNLATVPAETASRRFGTAYLRPFRLSGVLNRGVCSTRDAYLHVNGLLKLKFAPCRLSWRIVRAMTRKQYDPAAIGVPDGRSSKYVLQ